MRGDAFYRGLQARAERIKDDLLAFLIGRSAPASASPATAPRPRATRC